MKRLTALLLTAVMLLSLAACGQTSGSDGTQGEDGTTVSKDSICSVWVKINPEFELYLDENATIAALVCLNKDAEKAFKGVAVTGAEFEKGFRMLLDAVYEKGFVSDGEMQITWGYPD